MEIIPAKDKFYDSIKIKVEKKFCHIYLNNNKEEIKEYNIKNCKRVKNIKIIKIYSFNDEHPQNIKFILLILFLLNFLK